MRVRQRDRFHGSGLAVSLSWTEAAVITTASRVHDVDGDVPLAAVDLASACRRRYSAGGDRQTGRRRLATTWNWRRCSLTHGMVGRRGRCRGTSSSFTTQSAARSHKAPRTLLIRHYRAGTTQCLRSRSASAYRPGSTLVRRPRVSLALSSISDKRTSRRKLP